MLCVNRGEFVVQQLADMNMVAGVEMSLGSCWGRFWMNMRQCVVQPMVDSARQCVQALCEDLLEHWQFIFKLCFRMILTS